MYRELDNLLSEESTVDSWYDDGFLIAQSIMNDFSKDDWEKLSNDILNKDLEWKKKLVYCLDNQIIQEELEIIGKLLQKEWILQEMLQKECYNAFWKCLIFFKLGLYFRTPNNIQLLHIY